MEYQLIHEHQDGTTHLFDAIVDQIYTYLPNLSVFLDLPLYTQHSGMIILYKA